MFRRWMLGSAAIATLTGGLLAAPGIVTDRSNNTYTGDVSEDEPGKVTVKVHGIPMVINRADVKSIQYVDPGEDFQKKLAALGPADIKGRMDLAKWALGERKYDQAIQAAEAVLKIDPNNAEATEFIAMVRRQREMERNHPAPAAGTGTTPAAHAGTGSTTAPGNNESRKTLTADDINMIRQQEMSDNEDFRVQFNNDVRRKYCDTAKLNLADFQAMPAAAQAREIIKKAPDLRNDVRITSDPASFTAYKQKVQPVMMQGCATAGCHSGQTGGSFVMLNTAPESEATAYTNFYILTQYHKQIGKRTQGMIERTTPQRSLLLQYGLPPENADPKHPDVQNYRPIFRTPNDPRFQIIVKWLGEQLMVPAPDYSSIKYDIPKNESATPATQPSK